MECSRLAEQRFVAEGRLIPDLHRKRAQEEEMQGRLRLVAMRAETRDINPTSKEV